MSTEDLAQSRTPSRERSCESARRAALTLPSVSEQFLKRVRDSVEGLTPGYFALVMSSGILSVGMALKGHDILSLLLMLVCATAFVVLRSLTFWRFVAHRSAFNEDLLDPSRAFGFFTFVAGTNVLGVRLGMEGYHSVTADPSGA